MNPVPNESLFPVNGLLIRPLAYEDGGAVQALLERCADYAELFTGLPVGQADAISLYMNIPENKTEDDKVLLGLWDSSTQALIGVLDSVRDYPEPGIWFIGLLLLQPDRRAHGIGSQVVRAFADWAGRQGAEVFRLSVVEQAPRALHFWENLGFVAIDQQTSFQLDYKTNVIIILERKLTRTP